MTTTAVSLDDLNHLRRLMFELIEAGRTEELPPLARINATVQEMVCQDLLGDDEDEDPALLAALEEADRDFEAGRGIPHAEVVRWLAELGDG